jgi:hypothetical protein
MSAGFKGRAIDRTERVHVDTGLVAVTTKQIYFSGAKKAFRIPYTKIVSFEPFSDGLGIMRDAASAKPQIFMTNDGWFTYNLVTNLAAFDGPQRTVLQWHLEALGAAPFAVSNQ